MNLWDDIRREWERSQSVRHFLIEGEPLPRIPFGSERNRMSLANCPECNGGFGEMHMLGCTVEQCPLCDASACGCGCAYQQRPNQLLRE